MDVGARNRFFVIDVPGTHPSPIHLSNNFERVVVDREWVTRKPRS